MQRGNQVILNWPAPRRNAPDASVQSIRRIDVYRLAEPVDAPLPLTEDEFAARATLIGSVSLDPARPVGETLSYTDALALSEPVRLRYALRYVNAAGQRAAFSNFLLLEPASRVSQPPVMTAAPVTETAVTVRWQPPVANVDGSTPVNLLGYNVYRTVRAQNEPAGTPLNPGLITATEFADPSFTFGQEYIYVVRAVSLGTDGAQVESLNSNAIPVAPLDTFPPTAPTALSIGPAPGRLSLFFTANPERDVASYNVYRSTDPDLAKERWTKINRAPLDRTTYQDETVESGVRYYYYLTAIDRAGNTSPPSEVKSEIAP